MLFYDMVITFGDEVEKIWKQRLTGATVLWFLVSSTLTAPKANITDYHSPKNRYLSPLGYVVIIVCTYAHHSASRISY